MATVKIKFRPSTVKGKEGRLYYQVIHERMSRQLKSTYQIYPYEWNDRSSKIILPLLCEERKGYLLKVSYSLENDLKRFQRVISFLKSKHTPFYSDDIINTFLSFRQQKTLFVFMEEIICILKELGRARTSETYTATLRSFRRFREDRDIALDFIDADLMMAYESYLKHNHVSSNTRSFYMRILRAVYNRAVEKELTPQRFPFKHVYTGIDKTVKRAVPLDIIKSIKDLDLSLKPTLNIARDMFLFSFYTRGMSFVDMAYLKKKDLSNGIISYRRRKTGQKLHIKWEKCMQEIIDRYDTSKSAYLLPIFKNNGKSEHIQHQSTLHGINRKLKEIGHLLQLDLPLTMYVARHSWASAAKEKQIPLVVISEAMGHESEQTTQIYLTSLNANILDKANQLILNSI